MADFEDSDGTGPNHWDDDERRNREAAWPAHLVEPWGRLPPLQHRILTGPWTNTAESSFRQQWSLAVRMFRHQKWRIEDVLELAKHLPDGLGNNGYWPVIHEEWLEQANAAKAKPAEPTPDGLECIRLPAVAASVIPPRPWAYGKFMLFGSAAVIGAVDGAGKGAIAVVLALAMITGKPLLGEKVWRTGAVAIITYEDDETEWQRRIAAACQHHALDYLTILRSIYFLRRPGGRVSFAATSGDQTIFPDGDAIVAHLKNIKAVLLIVDPFNHAHELDDGNSNVLIARVAAEITRIAQKAWVAVLVLHHLRKGSSGAIDDLMGAVSLRATFRSCRILSRMTADEAAALNVTDKWRHLRVADSKENYAPPPDLANWYKLESVPLNNGTDDYPEGDEIGVAIAWTAPSAFENLPLEIIATTFDRIRQGPEPGELFSPTRGGKSDRWIGDPIMAASGKTPEQVAKIVAIWTKEGVLIEGSYKSPKQRRDRRCITLDEAKADLTLSPIKLFGADCE